MDWIEIVSYAVSGALGAAVAYLIVSDKKERRGIYIAVTVVAMFILHALAARFVLPGVYDWQTDRDLKKISIYSEIANSDPETYKKIKATLLNGRKKGESKRVVEGQVSSIVQGTLSRYIANASDRSVIAFVTDVTQDAQDLKRTNPDACYQLLFPQNFSSPDLIGLDDAATSKTLDKMADVLHSAAHNPQPPPDANESAELLKPVMDGLVEKYGSDLYILRRTATDKVEREKVCNMAIDLYTGILNLPARESSESLRDLLTAK